MVDYDTVSVFIKLQYAFGIPLDFVFVSLTLIWAGYFVNKIANCIKMHKACVREGNPDDARKNRCEMVKYAFLLLISIAECGYIQIYALGIVLPPEHLYLSSRHMLPNCSVELMHSHIFDINLIHENPFKAFLVASGQAGLLFSLAFLTSLLHYLHITLHDISLNPFHFIRRFLSLTSLLSFFLVIAGTVPHLILFAKVVEPLMELAYFLIWCRHSLRFYQTLKWRIREFRVRRPYLVRGSVENCRQFAVVMGCMGLGTLLFIIVDFVVSYFFLVSVALFYGPCLFNYVYGTPYYQPPLVSDGQIETLLYSYTIKVYVTSALLGVAYFTIVFQFFAASAVYFGLILRERLRMRFGKVNTRFRLSLNHRLLKYQY